MYNSESFKYFGRDSSFLLIGRKNIDAAKGVIKPVTAHSNEDVIVNRPTNVVK